MRVIEEQEKLIDFYGVFLITQLTGISDEYFRRR